MANIETTIELNKLLKEQNKLLEAQTKIMKSQADATKAMVESLNKISPESLSKSFGVMNQAVKDADKALEDFTNQGQDNINKMATTMEVAGDSSTELADNIEELGKKAVIVGGLLATIQGLPAGFNLATTAASGFLSIASTLVGTMFNLTTAILSAPFKILNTLMNVAASSGGASFFEQMEQTREVFGSLSKYEGKAVIDTFRNIRGELANTGLTSYRVLGNFAERLEKVRELAVQLGRQFSSFRKELVENSEAFIVYQKGLGLSEEGVMAMAKAAKAANKSFTETGREIASMAIQMGKQFDISNKLISQDVAEMIGDFENFGSVGVKTMTQVSVFTRKLGLEIKDLLGLVDKFDTFESAAESTAQLSQAFGVQLDALELLREQDPAARFESIRKSFMATGRSVENLNRQELKLLSTSTGLSAETLKLGFAQSNSATSYQEVQKQAAETEKKQLSQADAMKELADSIRVLVKEGQQMRGGFFDIFLQGFELGFRRSGPFRKAIWDLRRAMRATLGLGRSVGRMFATMMPGLKDILGGIQAMFDPVAFGRLSRGGFLTGEKSLIGRIQKDFRSFFQTMTKDPKTALKELFKHLQRDFFDFFNSTTPDGKKVLSGFQSFFETLISLFHAGIELALDGVVKGMNLLADLFTNPDKLLGQSAQASSGVTGWLAKVFQPIAKTIIDRWPDLQNAFMRLWDLAWTKFKGWAVPKISNLWEEFKMPIIKTLGAVLLGPTIIRGVLAAAAGGALALGKGLIGMIAGSVGKVASSATGAGGKLMGVMGEAMGSFGQASKSSSSVSIGSIKEIGKKMLAMGGAILVGGIALAGAIVAIDKILKAGGLDSPEKIVTPLMVLGAGLVGMVPASLAIKALGAVSVSAGLIGKALLGITAVSAVGVAMAGTFWAINKILSGVTKTGVEKTNQALLTVGKVYLMAGGLLVGGGAIGAVLIATGGIAIAPILAGIAAVATVATGMATHAMVLMKEIDKFKPDTGFEAKAKAFTSIMGSIGSFTSVTLDILKLSKPSFSGLLSFFSGGDPQKEFNNTLGLVKDVINAMKTQIVGIVTSLTQILGSVKLEDLQKGAQLGEFLKSVAVLAQAVIPPKEFKKGLLDFGSGPLEELTNYVGKLGDVLGGPTGLIVKLTSVFDAISGIKNFDSATVGVLSQYISSVTGMVQGFKEIDPESLENVSRVISGLDTAVLVPLSAHIPSIASHTSMISEEVKTIKEAFVGQTASGVRSVVAEINDIGKALESLKPINVKTELRALSDKLGLAGKGEEIRLAERNITIKVNVDAHIDAQELETVLIRRRGSKFAER